VQAIRAHPGHVDIVFIHGECDVSVDRCRDAQSRNGWRQTARGVRSGCFEFTFSV
jgi:hypothetical protein